MDVDFDWDDNEVMDEKKTARQDASMKSVEEQNVQLNGNPKQTDSNQDSGPLVESDGNAL